MTPIDEFTREDRLFVFDSSASAGLSFDYLSGRMPDGRQVLAGVYAGEEPYVPGTAQLQLLWFDAVGRFLATETVRPLLDTEPLPPPLTAEAFRGYRTARAYLAALGVVPGPIWVRYFWLYPNEDGDRSDPQYAPFRIGISLLRPWDPDYIWNPYGVPGAESLTDALRITNYATSGIPFGDFLLFWGEQVFGVSGSLPHDDPDRQTPAPYPLQVVPNRLYTLQTYGPSDPGPYFATGVLPDGKQGIMGWYDDQVVCLFFNARGERIASEERPTRFGMNQEFEGAQFRDAQYRAAQPVMAAWQTELGWRDQTIRVRFFMHPDRRIFLSDLSRSGVVGYYDPFQHADAGEREEARREVQSWLAEGCFVLNWMRDYHLSKDGEVLST